jgi:hypothetical protein
MPFMSVAALFDSLMFGALVATALLACRWPHVRALLTAEFGDRLLGGVIGATVQSALVFLVTERTRRRYVTRLAMMR